MSGAFFVLEKNLATATAGIERLTTKLMVNKHLLEGVRTVFAPHRTAPQQSVAADAKDCENLLADKVAIDTEIRKF